MRPVLFVIMVLIVVASAITAKPRIFVNPFSLPRVVPESVKPKQRPLPDWENCDPYQNWWNCDPIWRI